MQNVRPGTPARSDCDLHPAVPAMSVLLPYLDEYWREMVLGSRA
jgi:hypothetical protein